MATPNMRLHRVAKKSHTKRNFEETTRGLTAGSPGSMERSPCKARHRQTNQNLIRQKFGTTRNFPCWQNQEPTGMALFESSHRPTAGSPSERRFCTTRRNQIRWDLRPISTVLIWCSQRRAMKGLITWGSSLTSPNQCG